MSYYFYDIASKIDTLTENYSAENLKKIISYFSNNGVEKYFFRRIAGLITSDFDPNPWLKPLYLNGFFNPQNNPEPPESVESVYNSHWIVLPFLISISEKNKEISNEYMELLIKIIDSIIIYQDENKEKITNRITDDAILEIISNLPEEKIQKHHINFIRTVLEPSNTRFVSGDIKEIILPSFIDKRNKNLMIALLEIILDYREYKDTYESLMDKFWLNESIKIFKAQIYEICGIDAFNVAVEKIKEIVSDKPSEFRISAVESHSQNIFEDDYEYQLVAFIRYFLESSKPEEIINVTNELINEDHPIFNRIGIYTINYHYSEDCKELNDLFWNLEGIPLERFDLKHEIYELIKENCSDFSNEEVKKVIEWIENKNYYVSERFEVDSHEKDRIIAYQKLEWISALKNLKNQEITNLYHKYKKISPNEKEHPGFDRWVGEVKAIKPKKPKNLCDKANDEIAEILNKEKQKNESIHSYEKGFYNSFSACVSDNPVKFSKDLKPFLNISRNNQYELLDGLLNAWKDEKKFEWGELIDFILIIINDDQFWTEISGEFNYKDWMISLIADMIKERTKNDDYPFNKRLLRNICKILLILAEKTDSELHDRQDIFTSVLNSPKGQIYSSMIEFSLSYARLYKNKEEENKWIKPIKECIEKGLKNPSIELSVTIGQYLPFIFYLDENWVKLNIDIIFLDTNWKYVFEGYLSYSIHIYENIYLLLKNQYNKAINTDFSDKIASERLVYHICTAYIFDIEKIDENSLIYKLISNRDVNQLLGVIRFFLIQKDKHQEKISPKIKPLWKIIFDVTSTEPDKYKEVLSNLSKWLTFYDKIDEEIFKYLCFSAKYDDELLIINDLSKYVETYPKEIGKIYIELIQHNNNIYYKEEVIMQIIETLYRKGEKENADFICNVYGENGYYFLRYLYVKHNM